MVGPEGLWQGAIELPSGGLGVVVTLVPGEGGAWSGSIDIPAQSLRGFALSAVAVEADAIHFEMAGIPGRPTFDGRLVAGGDAIAGTFRQGGQELPFALVRADGESAACRGGDRRPGRRRRRSRAPARRGSGSACSTRVR